MTEFKTCLFEENALKTRKNCHSFCQVVPRIEVPGLFAGAGWPACWQRIKGYEEINDGQ